MSKLVSDTHSLDLDDDARARLKEWHQDGLLWLVNAAVLHPRGWALAIHIDDDGEPLGLSIQGDGQEPWCFEPGKNDDILHAFERREAERESR
jgi:hypothetical protein